MHDALAEHLLKKVLEWTSDDVRSARSRLEAMARYKYDDYQRFQPGMRFIESLILWLWQFNTIEERRAAYSFVEERLVFLSEAEMIHLVRTAYPDLIRPLIHTQAAQTAGIHEYLVGRIARSVEFKTARRKALFLGLSDGSRTDLFRRSARGEVSNEQVFQTHELSLTRAELMIDELNQDLTLIRKATSAESEHRFETVFLLDDFTGSGKTYLREQGDGLGGKLARFYESARDQNSSMSRLLDISSCDVHLVFYVATDQAIEHITHLLPSLCADDSVAQPHIHVIQRLAETCRVSEKRDGVFFKLCISDDYYDSSIEDASTNVGGSDVKLGFSQCALPVVLSHNTPNDSVAVLWSYEDCLFRGLFPRIPRHFESL